MYIFESGDGFFEQHSEFQISLSLSFQFFEPVAKISPLSSLNLNYS